MLIYTCHAPTALCRGVENSLSERYDRGMARVRHGICESNMAALCKSNGKDTIQTFSGTAWQGNGMVCVNEPLKVLSAVDVASCGLVVIFAKLLSDFKIPF
jgi:hypothetical protein